MSNLTVENVYTRHTAKGLAKKHFWKLLGMMAIVLIIVYAISFGGMFLLGALTGTSMSALEAGTATPSVLYIVGYLVLMLATTLVSGSLDLGLTAAMLDICRGDEPVTVGRVFSRMGQCLKAFGLSLWVGLKTFLWMLPGFMVMAAAIALGADSDNAGLISILPLLSMILVMVPVIPAAYRYMLSTYVLADKPETGVFECVRQSKALMKGHKWQAFKLIVPIVLETCAVQVSLYILTFLLNTALGNYKAMVLWIIVTVLYFIATLYVFLNCYMCTCVANCLFYLNRIGENQPAEEAAEEAPQAE